MRIGPGLPGAALLVSVCATPALPQATFTPFAVTSYTSAADSPLTAGDDRVILDVEADPVGAFTYSGITATVELNGDPVWVIASGTYTDSVDADDGSIDGDGSGGQSLAQEGNASVGSDGYRFVFDPEVFTAPIIELGVVWTDGSDQNLDVEMLFYDLNGAYLGTVTGANLGDGAFDGGTAEDRFFGASYADGFGSFLIRQPGSINSLELDHLQWVTSAVPEPASYALWGGVAALGFSTLRRVRRKLS